MSKQLRIGFHILDQVPPTTPGPVSVAPASAYQINVTWGAATDNVGVAGYRVYRDSVVIATTTTTNYIDTGLTPSTTYSYFVQAFDADHNHSSSTSPAATTTPAAPIIATSSPTDSPNPSTQSTYVTPAITKSAVHTTEHSASLAFTTNMYMQYSLRWGKTSSYELGSIESGIFALDHSTYIADLEPGTTYRYEITGITNTGVQVVLQTATFTTVAPPDTMPPSNVTGLTATANGNDVLLSWHSPVASDFAYVRVLRSYYFYPSDQTNGYILYQGTRENAIDTGVFSQSDTAYYSVFSYDTSGNISSGATVRVSKGPVASSGQTGSGASIVPPVANSSVGGGQSLSSTSSAATRSSNPTTTGTATSSTLTPRALDPSLLTFIQEGSTLPFKNGAVTGSAAWPTEITLPATEVSNEVQTILVSLTYPNGKTFSYLMRPDRTATRYLADLAPLPAAGYPVVVDMFNHDHQLMATIHSRFIVQPATAPVTPASIFSWPWWYFLLPLVLFGLLVLILLRLLMRRAA